MQFGQLKRREFITLLGGAAAAWPLTTRAQQSARLPTIGYLGSATPTTQGIWAAVFAQRLQELGWAEGRNVKIDVRWAEGRNERFAEIAAEFVALKVSVIVTSGGAVATVKKVTSTIPIVFVAAIDPVASGYVASLARPGGNITGLSLQSTDTVGKRLGFLREVVPDLRQLAIMTDGNPGNVVVMREAEGEAHMLGIEVTRSEIRRAEDIAPAFDALKDKAQALYVVSSPLTIANRVRINTLVLGRRLPAIYDNREFVEVGGLISYGPDSMDYYGHAADYVDKILRGAKPGDLPVQQPTKFALTINLTTAKTLGLTIPDKLLALADEVIE
jgi:putative ABC transport system substrate-binding protein